MHSLFHVVYGTLIVSSGKSHFFFHSLTSADMKAGVMTIAFLEVGYVSNVSLPTLLGRNFNPNMAFLFMALNLVSNSWRRWSRNGRNTKCRLCISGVSASALFVMVCLRVVCHGLPPRCLSWSASALFVMVCLRVVCHGLPPRCLSWSASALFVMVCLRVVCHGLPPRCLSWSASTLFVMVCLHVVCHGLPPRCLSWSASTLFVMVCLRVVCHGLPPRCLSWSASTLFVMVCLRVVCHGLPPTVPLYRGRCHCPSNVDRLCSHLVIL